ncbi:MAG: allophanate hydrolase [Pseudomonadota bacterium]
MQPDESQLLTIADWQQALRAGAALRPLLQARLARVFGADAAPHAWIHRCSPGALETRLRELDTLAAATPDRQALLAAFPLYGVPFAVKDNIDVAGLDTTAACPAWAHPAEASATVVQKLVDAGAVLLGKTNLDQFATGLVGTRSPYGAPASTWAADRVSGGSSSGSAVVVARGDVAFALGTDTAGSGRVPAGFNHLVGLKPTPGRASTAGVLPACRSLDCVSVFALTVEDAASVLALMEGPDEADDYSAFQPGPARLPSRLRVGVPRCPVLDADLGYTAAWQQALGRLRALGAELVDLDFEPLHQVARLLYSGPWVAERYAVVQRLLDSRPAKLDATVATVIGAARGFSAVDTFRAQYSLRHHQAQTAHLWAQVDMLLVPTAPRHPSFADVAADPVGANALLGTYTNFVNLLGWCALALPAGTTAGGLPFGVTVIAQAQHDAALARFGQRWQALCAQPLGATGRAWAPPPAPACWPATRRTLPLVVVGAHLSGLPLNWQLTERGATLRQATSTAPVYRLYELPGTQPRKPGLLRCAQGGQAIAVEVWDMPVDQVGSFLALIPPPLGLGSVLLADGSAVHGFLCEPVALDGARDITASGGWRAHLSSTAGTSTASR